MRILTRLIIITVLLLSGLRSVFAISQKEFNEYKLLKNEYSYTKKRLQTLKKNKKAYQTKKELALKRSDKVALKRYKEKLEAVDFEKYELIDDLAYLRDEIEGFDELEDS